MIDFVSKRKGRYMSSGKEVDIFIEKEVKAGNIFQQVFVFNIRGFGFMTTNDPQKILHILEEAQAFSGGDKSGIHGYLLKTVTGRDSLDEPLVYWSQSQNDDVNMITLWRWLEEKGMNLSSLVGMDWDG